MTKSVSFSQALRNWVDISTQHAMRGWSHHAKATGLSMPQFSILMLLYHRHACGISDISERFETTPAAASQHVDNLVQAGLIERAEDPHDRRAKQIQLSSKGRSMIEKGIGERYRWLEGLSRVINEKDQTKITEALVILTEAADKLDQNL